MGYTSQLWKTVRRKRVDSDRARMRTTPLFKTSTHAQLNLKSSHAREPPELWEYEFNGRSADSGVRMEWLLIEDTEGNRLGYAQHLQWCYDGWGEGKDTDANFMVMRMELKPGHRVSTSRAVAITGALEESEGDTDGRRE